MVQNPSQDLSHLPICTHRSPKDTSKFSMRTSYDLFLPDDSMRVSFLLAAWLADASSRTLWAGRRQRRGLSVKALVQPDPSHTQQSGMVMLAVPSILTEDQMTSGNPAPSSCPAWLSAWLPPSPVSSHSPSGAQSREFKEEGASSARVPKAQLRDKRGQSTPRAWKEGKEGRREVGQGNWDRFKRILRKLIRPGSHFRNEVLNQLLIHNSSASARQRVWLTLMYSQFL